MTSTPAGEDPERQWQQPAFDPARETPTPFGQPSHDLVNPVDADRLLPAESRRPPSVLESVLNITNGVLWPVLLGLALFGIGNWVLNVVIAIVASSLFGGISTELRRRRKYQPPTGEELR